MTEKNYCQVVGDITTDYVTSDCLIVQVNNCVARKPKVKSLTWNLKEKFHWANPYQHRVKSMNFNNLATPSSRPELGSISIICPPRNIFTGAKRDGPTFACIFSQYKMGLPTSDYFNKKLLYLDEKYKKYSASAYDSRVMRYSYFKSGLNKLMRELRFNPEYSHLSKIIFPAFIGCHSGGGDWKLYEEEIKKFSRKMRGRKRVIVVTYTAHETTC